MPVAQGTGPTGSTGPPRGRFYTTIGLFVIALLVTVGLLGVIGVGAPGVLGQGEAFFILGAGLLVLAAGLLVVLFALGETLNEIGALRESAGQDQRLVQRLNDMDEDLSLMREEVESRMTSIEADLSTVWSHTMTSDEGRAGTPFGDIHDVIDVEGIGEIYEGKLAELGIVDTEQLWLAEAEDVAGELDIAPKTVRSWQAMAELMALDGVGPQYAELLVRGGVTTIQELKQADPAALTHRLKETEATRDVRIQGNVIAESRTRSWIQAAKEHDPERMRVRR